MEDEMHWLRRKLSLFCPLSTICSFFSFSFISVAFSVSFYLAVLLDSFHGLRTYSSLNCVRSSVFWFRCSSSLPFGYETNSIKERKLLDASPSQWLSGFLSWQFHRP